jgi:hypothetical protein
MNILTQLGTIIHVPREHDDMNTLNVPLLLSKYTLLEASLC